MITERTFLTGLLFYLLGTGLLSLAVAIGQATVTYWLWDVKSETSLVTVLGFTGFALLVGGPAVFWLTLPMLAFVRRWKVRSS